MPFLPLKTTEIVLKRDPDGLGFYIRGGLDIPHTPGDPGIFVSRLKNRGAALRNNLLREGDKICKVNGRDIEQVMHAEAVRILVSALDPVKLVIQKGAYSYLLNRFAWAMKNLARELWPASWYAAQYAVENNITVWRATPLKSDERDFEKPPPTL